LSRCGRPSRVGFERQNRRSSSRARTGTRMGASGAEGKGGPSPRFFSCRPWLSHRAPTQTTALAALPVRC
jgi:hypothetical protein